jgi:hypothetical protein
LLISHFLALRQRQNLSKELLEYDLLVGRYSPIYIGHYSQKIGYGLGVSGGWHTKIFCIFVKKSTMLNNFPQEKNSTIFVQFLGQIY